MKDFPLIFSGPMVQANRKGIKRMTRRVVDMDRLWVVMRKDVRPDFPLLLRPEQRNMLAPAGAKLRGVIHGAGAVSCRLPAGGTLGVKPGEFDFVCPYAQGETVLATAGGKNTWTLIPRESRVWVRETWADINSYGEAAIAYKAGNDTVYFVGSPHENGIFLVDDSVLEPYSFAVWGDDLFSGSSKGWHPSIHMPRWVCRDVYTVTKVRVERLQAITEADAIAEGMQKNWIGTYWCGAPHKAHGAPRQHNTAVEAFADLWDFLNGKKPGRAWKDNPWVWVVEYDNPLWKQGDSHVG